MAERAAEEVGMADSVRLLDRFADAATVRRAFGESVERDGVVVIPVARVLGGGGGGEGGQDPEGQQGAGGGFAMRVTPAGVFVLRDGKVSWQPAVDVNRIVAGGQVVAVIALLVLRSLLRYRARRAAAVD
jgi:uncharacterized spore protein YtfJ